jgi:ribosome-associated protein
MESEALKQLVVDALEDVKGKDIKCIDVSALTNVTDHMIIVSGTSNRHLKSLADSVVTKAKEQGCHLIGVEGEGEEQTDWILVDLGDVVVHVMLPKTREFYDLEHLWTAYADTKATTHS